MIELQWESSPAREGMNENKLIAAFSLLDHAIREKKTPGATAAICRNGKLVAVYASGRLMKEGPEVASDSIYDCASLTKVAVTLPLALKLLEDGKLDAREKVAAYIPEFKEGEKAVITIQQLLTHSSGLKPFVRGDFKGWSPEEIKRHIYTRDLENQPGAHMVYSDLGFIILGEIISLILNQPLDEAADQMVFAPLAMKDSLFNPPQHLRGRIAATEYREELGTYQRGEVHDERALALGGASGHAGLFSTVFDLVRYVNMWLNKGRTEKGAYLSPLTVEAATRNYTAEIDGNRGLGWVLKGDPFDASGILFSPGSYGHTGFTGTSIWMDPSNQLGVVLLTNRVHYGREVSILGLRRRFHNAIAGSIDSSQPD